MRYEAMTDEELLAAARFSSDPLTEALVARLLRALDNIDKASFPATGEGVALMEDQENGQAPEDAA